MESKIYISNRCACRHMNICHCVALRQKRQHKNHLVKMEIVRGWNEAQLPVCLQARWGILIPLKVEQHQLLFEGQGHKDKNSVSSPGAS